MAGDVAVQALAVLYDLALTIGSEVTLDALLTRTLQRLLYHTGFPAGIAHSRPLVCGAEGEQVRIEAAVGNYRLLKQRGERIMLPAALVEGAPALVDAPELLRTIPARRPYRFALHLPIEEYGGILLFSPDPPQSDLPLTELFAPIMSRLATAISLCKRVEERTQALELANRELEAFSYSVSHDLRAPLRAVDGFSRLLDEGYADRLDAEGRRLLGLVRGNAARMAQLIEDMLAFSRMARRELVTTPVDMTALAHEVAAELQAAAPDRALRFDIGTLPPAQGDRSMLRQVFVNLLSNAVKFTRPRAEALIGVAGEITADGAVYSVRDNGVGFDMNYAGKLFGVFERLHAQSDFEGTGIGLAIVKRIVARHGGQVCGQSRLGEGAEFSFSLPLAGAPK